MKMTGTNRHGEPFAVNLPNHRKNLIKKVSGAFVTFVAIATLLLARPQISSASGRCSTTTGDCSTSIGLYIG